MPSEKETRDMLAYLRDTLPASRRATFEARLQADPELQKQLEALRLTTEGLRQLALMHQLRINHSVVVAPRPLWAEPRRITAVAASVALFLIVSVGVYRTYFSISQRLFDDFYRPDAGFRGVAGVDCGANLGPVVLLYKQKEYTQALTQLEKVPNQNLACVHYRKGMILLGLNKAQEAISSLRQVTDQSTADPRLRQQAEWYLSLAYLLDTNKDEARSRLTKITNSTNHPFSQAADRLLKRLDQ